MVRIGIVSTIIAMADRMSPRHPANTAVDVSAAVGLSSSRSVASLQHQDDIPRLSLHDYHKWQHSPLLSLSPELDYKKVRRKPSLANLSASPVQGDSPWAPSSHSPPPLHSFSQRDLPPRFNPHPPTTPISHAYPASPSLSSTVTTLQSTPTHTPIVRGDAHFIQQRIDERTALEEPIRTKRKFDSLKRAKRFPRQAGSGSSSSRDGGLWEVYAEVFDISGDHGGLSEGPVSSAEDLNGQTEQKQQQQVEDLTHPHPTPREARSVRFKEVDIESKRGHHHTRTSSSTSNVPERDRTATSSLSLSKFEFPAPPGLDNWARTSGKYLTHHVRAPHLLTCFTAHSPSSPSATFLYHGASFDLINPHASLILHPHNIETPGEIDGLLDDYFEDDDEDQANANMSYNHLTGEISQQSQRIPSDNSRSGRTLYDDATTARRNILGVEDEPAMPPPVLRRNPTNPFHDSASVPAEFREGKGKAPALPQQQPPLRRVGTNPLRRLPSLGRSVGAGDVVGDDRQPRSVPRFSDPFDLTVSDNGNIVELRSIDGILGRERVAVAGEGVVAQASEETDAAMRSLLNKYDDTRQSLPPPLNESPSVEEIERGLGYGGGAGEEVDFGYYTPVPASTPFRTSYGLLDSLPAPPAPVYGGMRLSRGSELPTSEQTYGETNQLLMITPAQQARSAPGGRLHAHSSSHHRRANHPTDNFFTAAEASTVAGPSLFRSSSVYPATENGSVWQTEMGDSDDDADSYADTSVDGSTIRFSRPEPQPTAQEQQLPRGFWTKAELVEQFNRDRVEKGDPSIRYEVREAMRILQDKVASELQGYHLRPDHERPDFDARREDLQKLEQMRQEDRTIVQEASERLAQIAEKNVYANSSFFSRVRQDMAKATRNVYQSSSSFRKFKGFHHTNTASDTGSFSSRRGLITPARPALRSNLEFSESEGTFVTVRDRDSPFDDHHANEWCPNDPNPTARALGFPTATPSSTAAARALGLSPPSSRPDTATRVPLQFRSTTRVNRPGRPAIGSQIELQELRLIKNVNAARSPGRALTNAELIEREPGWSEFPDNPYRSRRQPTLAPCVNSVRQEQKRVSRAVATACAACPITSLAFALGGFDWYIASRSSGRVRKMGSREKRVALYLYTPLSLIGWAVIVIVIVLAIRLSKD